MIAKAKRILEDQKEAKECNDSILKAAKIGKLGALRHFVRENPEVVHFQDERNGETPLHEAARFDQGKAVNFLLSKGSSVNAINKYGRTPLHKAAKEGHEEPLNLLIENGASVKAKKELRGATPLHLAAESGHATIAQLLIDANADVNAATKFNSETPLHNAAYGGHVDCVRVLVAAGASLEAIAADGMTPLDKAQQQDQKKVVRMLEKDTAKPKSDLRKNKRKAAVNIADGELAPPCMFSARFDNGPIEKKFRKVHKILLHHNFRSLMVDANSGDNFGTQTMECLAQIQEEQGLVLAVCTADYAEKTSSHFSSHEELKYAYTNEMKVVPLRVVDHYPPTPPFGRHHPYDKKGLGKVLVNMAIPRSTVWIDCREKPANEVAEMIAQRLLNAAPTAGHGRGSQ